MAARSNRPTVWIEPRPPKRGPYRVRAEIDGRRLPDTPCGMSAEHAREVRAQVERDLWADQLRVASPQKKARTLEQFKAEYLRYSAGHKATSTTYIDRRALELLATFAGNPILMNVDRARIEAWKLWLLDRYGPNGVSIRLRAAHAAFRYAFKNGWIDRDPFFGVALPPQVDVAHPPSDEEIGKMWPFIPRETQRALAAMAFLGLRRSEVLSITCASLTPGDPWMLRVRKAKTRRGKEEYKELALSPEALAAMQPLPASGPVFKLSARLLSSHLEKARKRAGLGRIRLHDFRHRWASEFMSAVKDEYALMQAGGWTSRAAAARYQHSTEARRRANLQVKVGVPPPPLPQKGS